MLIFKRPSIGRNLGESHSSGVGIVINLGLNYKVLHFDFQGRDLVLDLSINTLEFRLINVYLPNIHAERKEFISKLSTFMHTKKNIVLGGDFNFVEDIALDKEGGNLKFGDIGKV